MTGPIHLSTAWALVIAIVVVILLNAWTYWRIRKLLREAESEPWPRRDKGGAYLWEDGRVTKDKDGRQIVGWWKSPDPGAPQ